MTSSVENVMFGPFLCTVQCAVCSSPYRQLKLLECYHSCCLKCFGDDTDKITCPKCQFVTDLTMGFNSLPENCLQKCEGLLEVLSGSNACKNCANPAESTNIPSHVCFECMGKTLCANCHTSHENAQDTQRHTPVAIADIFDSAVNIADQVASAFKWELCLQHPDVGEVLNFYCRSCSLLVCQQCVTECHVGHACSNIGEVGQERRVELATKLRSLKLKLAEVTTAIADRKGLVGESESQLTDFETLKIRIQDTVSFVDLFRKMASDSDVIKHADALTDHVTQLNHQVDVMEDIGLDALEISSTKAEPPSVDCPNVTEVKTPRVYTASELRNMRMGSIVTAVEDVKTGKLPEVKMKEYSVMAVTRWISGLCMNNYSEVCVLTGKLLRYFSYQGEVRGVVRLKVENGSDMQCVDTEFYVTDSDKRTVVKINRTGDVIQRIDLPAKERQWQDYPCSLATNEEGKVFITSFASCIIYQYEARDNILSEYITKDEERQLRHNPYSLALADNGDLIVNTNKSVMAIRNTKETRFNNKKYGNMQGMCTDVLGHIYMADYSKSRVAVLSSSGDFITYILTKETHGIRRPRRVAISPHGEYLAVSYNDTKISLFKVA